MLSFFYSWHVTGKRFSILKTYLIFTAETQISIAGNLYPTLKVSVGVGKGFPITAAIWRCI